MKPDTTQPTGTWPNGSRTASSTPATISMKAASARWAPKCVMSVAANAGYSRPCASTTVPRSSRSGTTGTVTPSTGRTLTFSRPMPLRPGSSRLMIMRLTTTGPATPPRILRSRPRPNSSSASLPPSRPITSTCRSRSRRSSRASMQACSSTAPTGWAPPRFTCSTRASSALTNPAGTAARPIAKRRLPRIAPCSARSRKSG